MKAVKVLGNCCASCRNTVQLIQEVARARGVEVAVEKVEDIDVISSYGVMTVPAVVVGGVVVHAGGVPSRAKVESWL